LAIPAVKKAISRQNPSNESRIVLKKTQTIPIQAEADLVLAVRRDPERFGEIYERYFRQIYRYLYSRVGNTQEAEDLTAQTFLAALEKIENFRADGCLPAWLFGIARNKFVDHYRQRDHSTPLGENEPISTESDLLGGVIRSERSTALSRSIRALPEGERELLRLRYLGEMSFSELAQVLSKNEDAVKKSLYRLLERLQRQLEVSND
jgi:RNA polymerase sigma factor (sigma-70 family)